VEEIVEVFLETLDIETRALILTEARHRTSLTVNSLRQLVRHLDANMSRQRIRTDNARPFRLPDNSSVFDNFDVLLMYY
jgi:hypothetical protein